VSEDTKRPQINSAKLRVGGEIAGAIFTLGSVLIFLLGIPVLRYMFPAAILVGCAVALVLHFIRHENPGTPWLLSATEQERQVPAEPEGKGDRGRSEKISMTVQPPVDLSVAVSFSKSA
jgi:hypothetical protein